MRKTSATGCGVRRGKSSCPPRNGSFRSWTAIVADYRKTCLRRSRQELERFRLRRGMPSLKDAIEVAALSQDENGEPYPHQVKNWRFWPEGIAEATEALLETADRIEACSDFDELHDLVTEVIAGIPGVRTLYAYDVSLRIGAWLGCWPTKVYLHAGTRKGAKKLGMDTKRGTLEMAVFPAELQALPPYQVEDILCHYKDAFPTM